MSSLCRKLHKVHRLALPAAKQKEEEEEETETSEPCGLKLFWWEPDAPDAVGCFVKLNPNTLLSVQVEPQAGDATETYGQRTFQK